MAAKVAVLFFAVCAMVAISSVQGKPQGLTNPLGAMRDIVSNVAGRVGNGIVSRYDSQKDTIYKAIDSILGIGQKRVEAAADGTKAFLLTVALPVKLIRNTVANGSE